MNTIILGNSGSGKSTLARALNNDSTACLSLDEVAFSEGAERQTLSASVAAVEQFISGNTAWIIEGCYADILEPVMQHCERFIFLNPGTATCVAHCRARPWEPDKFASKTLQDEHLDALIEWVRQYDTRQDEYGLAAHRRLFKTHEGFKLELTDPREYIRSLNPLA